MTDEPAFLAAIADRPGDPTPRLVYADWLDDRDDPRAELVRVEEEMRTLPADADRYWALKPRRNELRAGCSADWLAALGYGTVYRPVLAPWPTAGVKGRFRLLRELVERWYGEPMPDAGGRAAEVAAVEALLGRAFPAAIQEWIAFALDIADGPGKANVILRDPFNTDETVAGWPNLGVVSLLEQAEGDILWAVPADRMAEPDPPVQVHQLDYEGDEEYGPVGESLGAVTEFAFVYLASYLGGGASWGPDRVAVAADAFPVYVEIGSMDVMEADNLLVTIGTGYEPDPDARPLTYRTRGPIPDPAFAAWVEGLRRR